MSSLGPVLPIATRALRIVKVRKHLLHPPEAWSRVVPDLHPQALLALPDQGCPSTLLAERNCDPGGLPEACVRCLQHHHDAHFAPAYLRAVVEGEDAGLHGRAIGRPDVQLCVGRRGEMVWLDVHQNRRVVTTAYRAGPRRGPPWSEERIFDRAVLSLRDKTSYLGGEHMNGNDWLAKAATELEGLLQTDDADPERALVLLTRLIDGAQVGGPAVPFAAARRKAAWLAAVDLDDVSCLDELAEALLDGDTTWAEPLDRLLAVDGRVGLLRLAGRIDDASSLAARAAAIAELHAELLQEISPFASMRLQTLGEGPPQRDLWEVVELSSVMGASAALPAAPRLPARRTAWVPTSAYALAATSPESTSWELRSDGDRLGWLNHEDGLATFEAVAVTEAEAPSLVVEVVDVTGTVARSHEIALRRDGPRWYAELGAAAGAGSLLQQLVASVPGGSLRIVIRHG